MNNSLLSFISFLLILLTGTVTAQSSTIKSDSIWCDNLNEIIKCASLDVITDRIGTIIDTITIKPFKPRIKLAPLKETIEKQYNKVQYTGYLYASPTLSATINTQFIQWHKKIKACLYLWEETRLTNADSKLQAYPDYFITNSEDETTVRLDVLKESGLYYVRLRIY